MVDFFTGIDFRVCVIIFAKAFFPLVKQSWGHPINSLIPKSGSIPDCFTKGHRVPKGKTNFMNFYSRSLTACLVGFGFVANVMAATCPSGSTMVGANMAYTFTQPNNGKCEMPGYNLTTIPDELSAIYNGTLVGTAIKVCPNGYLNGSSCTDYAQGHCESGYYDMAGVGASAVSERVGNTCVVGGYAVRELPNSVYAIYNGFTAGTTISLCGADAYRNGSSCVSLTGVGCPTNYKKLPLASDVLSMMPDSGSCDNTKHSYSFNQSCDASPTEDSCVLVCGDGYSYTNVGTCEANTITIIWNNEDGTQYGDAGSCTYSDSLSVPAQAPTKRGYTFTGWVFGD